MRRRDVLALLTGPLAWPAASGRSAAQAPFRRIAILFGLAGGDAQGELRIGLVKERMRQLGWELGTKLEILAFYSGAEPDFASAGELPIQAPNKFELIINQKTARDLSIAIPMQLLASADEVIE